MASAIGNYVGPSNLFGQVENTAPFLIPEIRERALKPGVRLIEAGEDPRGYLEVLSGASILESAELADEARLEDYFAFCLACHHATVATFVPTGVDSKIRGLLWRQNRNRESLRRMFDFALRASRWSIDGISRRATRLAGVGPVSGHDGEYLSVLAGALGAFLKHGDTEYTMKAAQAIDAELEREAAEFHFARGRNGLELDVLRVAATLTHNAGDLNQGISFWPAQGAHAEARLRFGRLAHENSDAYGGVYQAAARIYRRAMSAEGHRNYPLRGVKALRQSPDLLLPLGPFLDEWGEVAATHPLLDRQAQADVFAALIHGCRTIPGQRGYARALHGMANRLGSSLGSVLRLMPARARSDWKDAALRKQVIVPRISFESMMRKLAE